MAETEKYGAGGISPEDLYAAAQLKGRMQTRLDREFCREFLEDKELEKQVNPRVLAALDTEGLLRFSMNSLQQEEEKETAALQDTEEETAEPVAVSEEEQLRYEKFGLVPCGMEGISVLISASGLFAEISLEEPIAQPEDAVIKKEFVEPTVENLEKALQQAGVTTGIDKTVLTALSANPVYKEEIVAARGTAPKDGTDGRLQYHFEVNPDLSPRVDEHGRVDYKNLQYAQNVSEGELLCEIISPTPGISGLTVRGMTIPAKNGKIVPTVNGKNTVLSGDGKKITAACDGQVALKNGKITVSKILSLDNVDASTGNILFVGSVTVNGDVRGGYTIRVGGDIKVNGTVENATLVAGGNIVVNQGIKHGNVTAGGSLRARFLESAQVSADGDIYADVMLNSKVTAKGDVKLSGTHSCIVGGFCSAKNRIDCRDIGNDANIPTEILLTGRSHLQKQYDKAKEIKEAYPAQLELLINLMMKLDRTEMPEAVKQTAVARLTYLKLKMEADSRMLEEELADLDKRLRRQSDGLIIARGEIYPNVTFNLNGLIGRNQTVRKFATVALRDGQVTYGVANGL